MWGADSGKFKCQEIVRKGNSASDINEKLTKGDA